jgi:redox-sensitive bicupin YhaK (pirin superfamily)
MDAADDAPIETILVPRTSDLGDGFTVRRALPAIGRRMVGPFVFFDEFGPVTLGAGRGLDVRPHPHIGLATVTYLFEGEILHRDDLGSVQRIRPGEVNWMTAGRGIVHSERTPPELRPAGPRLAGIQTWVALPARHEVAPPAFAHHPVDALPSIDDAGVRLRLVLGTLAGRASPVAVHSEMFYAAVDLDAGGRLPLAAEHEERAAYVVSGALGVEGEEGGAAAGTLVVFRPGAEVVLRGGAAGARAMLLGGATMDGPRHVWWNFVSSSPERIEQAKADWREGRFGRIPGEVDFIPLPADA